MASTAVTIDRPGTAMCECGSSSSKISSHGGSFVVRRANRHTTIIPAGSEYASRIERLVTSSV